MSINDLIEKIKSFSADIKDRTYGPEIGLKIGVDLFIVAIIILVGTASFGLGKLSAIEKKKTPIVVYKTDQALLSTVLKNQSSVEGEGGASADSRATQSSSASVIAPSKGLVFASKTGKKYYYPWCSGADRIKETNKVWFATIEEAKSAGYTPATGCAGLK